MGEYKLFFDLIGPQFVKVFEYSGPSPSKIIKQIRDPVMDIMQIEGPSFYEDSLKWDNGGDPLKFFGIWRGIEGKDERSKVTMFIKLQGEESPKTKEGKLIMWIRYYLTVNIPYNNALQKSFAFLNANLFYKKRTKQYQEEARRRMNDFEDMLRNIFDLVRKTRV